MVLKISGTQMNYLKSNYSRNLAVRKGFVFFINNWFYTFVYNALMIRQHFCTMTFIQVISNNKHYSKQTHSVYKYKKYIH